MLVGHVDDQQQFNAIYNIVCTAQREQMLADCLAVVWRNVCVRVHVRC